MDNPGPSSSRSFLSSPPKKRLKRSRLTSNEKTIAINIYKYVEKSMTTYPYKTEVIKTTAQIMGTAQSTIANVLKEYKNTGILSSPPKRISANHGIIEKLDDFLLTAIRRKVHQFYFDGELPTIDKVLKAVNEDEDLPTFTRTTFYRIMKMLNFQYQKRSRKSILLDRADLQIWRKKYLTQIRDFRQENRKIYYLDETWVNAGHTMNFVWVDDEIKTSRQAFLRGLSAGLKNPSKGKRLIIAHIGSSEGFLQDALWVFEAKKSDGDYHGEMDAHNFENWFKTILEKIEPGSVIVMDNATYHSRRIENLPNMSWRKADIQNWLASKEILFEEQEIKAELLAKINKDSYLIRYVDEIAKTKNVTVCRLPPYHCELNPIELIWAQIKSYVARNNKTFKFSEVKALLQAGVNNIGANEWQKCISHVIKEEEKMMSFDGILDKATTGVTTPFIINVEPNSESSDLSDSEKEN